MTDDPVDMLDAVDEDAITWRGHEIAVFESKHPRASRAATAGRGYGAAHRKRRAQWAKRVAAGDVNCARCGQPIRPDEPWDLDHTPDRTGYLGPSHARCNRATMAHRPPRRRPDEPHPGLLDTQP
jgi:hypothetical protein